MKTSDPLSEPDRKSASSRPLRLLVVAADRFPPFRVDVAVLFGKELVKRGFSIDWVLQSDAHCDADYVTNWSGGKVWVGRTDLGTSRSARLRKHFLAFISELKLFGILRRHRYDGVIVKDLFITPVIAMAAAAIVGVPVIYWLSYPFPEESLLLAREGRARYPVYYRIRGWLFGLLLYRVILPNVRHVFVQSEQMRCDVERHGVPRQKMTPIPMGVDLEKIPSGVAAGGTAGMEGRPTIAYLGTMIKVRRLDFLIRAVAIVRKSILGVRLIMIGDGDDESDRQLLRDEVKRCNLEDVVEFTGFLPMEAAWRIVAACDVCVSPFFPTPVLNSTSPTKLVEYMAMGKPVVANDHPEQRQVIADSQGGICVPWDESAFAAALVRLLSAPELAVSMGERGRFYVQNHRSYAAIARAVEGTLRSVLDAGAGPLHDS